MVIAAYLQGREYPAEVDLEVESGAGELPVREPGRRRKRRAAVPDSTSGPATVAEPVSMGISLEALAPCPACHRLARRIVAIGGQGRGWVCSPEIIRLICATCQVVVGEVGLISRRTLVKVAQVYPVAVPE